MPIDCRCTNPQCGKAFTVPDTSAGRPVVCKACGTRFVVTRAVTSVHEPPWDPVSASAPVVAPQSAASVALTAVGRFVIRAKLGAGAFGTVYRAYDPDLEREVALKVPNPGVMTDARRAERFVREAKLAARLWHPNIVPVFEAGKSGEHYYIASALVDGVPLSDDIPERGADLARAVWLARELAEALAYAHDNNIVHRDVKPQNVMIDKQGRLLLMDFGLASLQEDDARMTRDGTVMGTPAYMSPEQARGESADVTPAADQYAVGVVLYELLTGRVPFRGPVASVMHNVIHSAPEPPRARRPEVPAELEAICLKAMAKRPEDRYASCAALAAALRAWETRTASSASRTELDAELVDTGESAEAEPRRAPAGRKWLLVGGGAALVLVVAGVAIVLSGKAKQPEVAKEPPPVVPKDTGPKPPDGPKQKPKEPDKVVPPKPKDDKLPPVGPVAKAELAPAPRAVVTPPPAPEMAVPALKEKWSVASKAKLDTPTAVFDADGQTLALVSTVGPVAVAAHNPLTGALKRELPSTATKGRAEFAFGLEKGKFGFVTDEREVVLWDSSNATGRVSRAPVPGAADIPGALLVRRSSDEKFIAVGCARPEPGAKAAPATTLRVLSTATGISAVTLDWQPGEVLFAADSSRVLVADDTDRFRWYKLPSGKPDGEWAFERAADGRNARVMGLSATGGAILYFGTPPGKESGPHLLDADTGAVRASFPVNRYQDTGGAVSDDGRLVVLIRAEGDPAGPSADLFDARGTRLATVKLPHDGAPVAVSWKAKVLAVYDRDAQRLTAYELPAAPAP